MTSFDVLAELFAKDVDPSLQARALARTPTERIAWLEEMQAFAEAARKARDEKLVDLGYLKALQK